MVLKSTWKSISFNRILESFLQLSRGKGEVYPPYLEQWGVVYRFLPTKLCQQSFWSWLGLSCIVSKLSPGQGENPTLVAYLQNGLNQFVPLYVASKSLTGKYIPLMVCSTKRICQRWCSGTSKLGPRKPLNFGLDFLNALILTVEETSFHVLRFSCWRMPQLVTWKGQVGREWSGSKHVTEEDFRWFHSQTGKKYPADLIHLRNCDNKLF